MAIRIKSDKLREIREMKKMSRKDLGNAVGLSEDKIVNIEEGRSGQTNQTVKYVEQICDYFSVSRNDIINYDWKNVKFVVFGAGKGGTGKTTTTAETIYHLSKKYNVLAIDGDPQGNLSKMLGFQEIKKKNLYSLITVEEKEIGVLNIEDFIHRSRLNNVNAITFHTSMYAADKILNQRFVPLSIFKKIKDSIVEEGKYDFVVIDTSPQVTTYTMGLYAMSDKFYIPLDLAPFTIDSLPTFLETLNGVKSIKSSMWPNDEFKISGIIKTKADMRQLISKEVSNFIDTSLPFPVISEIIPRTTFIEQAQYSSLFMEEFEKRDNSAIKLTKAYEKIAKEVAK